MYLNELLKQLILGSEDKEDRGTNGGLKNSAPVSALPAYSKTAVTTGPRPPSYDLTSNDPRAVVGTSPKGKQGLRQERVPYKQIYFGPKNNKIHVCLYLIRDPSALKPELLNPALHEFREGDFVQGYVTVINTSSKPFSFDKFETVLVGEMSKGKSISRTFLEMFDHSSSSIGEKGILQPDVTYKQNFSFHIPTRLLDSECPTGSLTSHLSLLSTFGNDADFSNHVLSVNYTLCCTFKSSIAGELVVLRDFRRVIRIVNFSYPEPDRTKLTSDYDLFISGIRNWISKGHDLAKEVPENFKEMALSLEGRNEVPRKSQDVSQDDTELEEFKDFGLETGTKILDDKYKVGANAVGTNKEVATSNNLSNLKSDVWDFEEQDHDLYLTYFPVRGLHNKFVQVSSPKVTYYLAYVPPALYRSPSEPSNSATDTWHVTVPLILTFDFDCKFYVKKVSTELVVVTLESPIHPIPIELHHDIIYNNPKSTLASQNSDADTFKNNIMLEMSRLNNELYQLSVLRKANLIDFPIEKSMVRGIKALTKVKVSSTALESHLTYVNFRNPDSGVFVRWERRHGMTRSETIKVSCELSKSCLKSKIPKDHHTMKRTYDSATLLPSFHSCYISRMYYLKINLELTSGQTVFIKVPINMVHEDTFYLPPDS